jgi:hypothetical protein
VENVDDGKPIEYVTASSLTVEKFVIERGD